MGLSPSQTRYMPSTPPDKDSEENALVSTKHALQFLYEDALRNGQYAMAIILNDTLSFCEKIISDKACDAAGLEKTGRDAL